LATANGWAPLANEVPLGPVALPPTRVTPRTDAGKEAFLKKGFCLKNAHNHSNNGTKKVHYGTHTFHMANGPITLQTLRVGQRDQTSRPNDPVYVASHNRASNQIRLTEYMARAMDGTPVTIHGNRFHHSTVIAALNAHASTAHVLSTNSVCTHDTGKASHLVGYTWH